jgi:diguanylate cyclase (GGDEF)-like protein
MDGVKSEELRIAGITLLEELGRGAHSVVLRGRRGDRDVAVKLLRSQGVYDAAPLHRRFYREAGLQARIRHPGLPAILDVGESDGRPYLVMEYLEGRTLATVLEDGPIGETRAVSIARAVASVLAEIHRRGLVHRDLKPHNVIVDRNGVARIIDFGFATRVASHEEERVGTFLYSAPEQSGMLKRPVDARSDLYALGAILYECCAGEPPFVADDLGELLRLHAGTRAPDLTDVSPALAAVVARLLAKDPEERYATAESLVADLDALPALNAALRVGGEFVLGGSAEPAGGVHPAPLVGREAELNLLNDLWNHAVKGRGRMVVLEGDPGCGKSRVLSELRQGARHGGAMVIHCGAPPDAIPLGLIRDAVEDGLRQIRHLPPIPRRALEERLQAELAEAAPLLANLSPALAAMLGGAAPSPLSEETRDPFFDAVVDLLLRLSDTRHALLLTVDDLDRADEASRQVLRRLAARVDGAHLLVAASSRRGGGEEWGEALSARVRLEGLEEREIGLLLGAHLGSAAPPELVARVAGWSDGNPLAAEELLEAILEEGCLCPSWGRWRLDSAALARLTLPGGIAELVARRIERIGPAARPFLEAAAVAGPRFRVGVLARVCEGDPSDALDEGIRLRILEGGGAEEWAFVHDHVRLALLGAVERPRLRRLHARLARVLEEEAQPRYVYAIARHYALAEEEDATRVHRTSLAAGLAAIVDGADEDAHRYLEQAREAGQAAGLPLESSLLIGLGGVCYRTGRLDEAEGWFRTALEGESKAVERALLYGRLAEVRLARYDTRGALVEVERAFVELGERLPRGGGVGLVGTGFAALAASLARVGKGRPTEEPAERARLEALVALYEIAGHAAYFQVRPVLLLEIAVRSLRAATRLGPSRAQARALCNHALVLALLGHEGGVDAVTDEALAEAEKLGDRMLSAHVRLYRTMSFHILGRCQEAEKEGRETLARHGRWLDAYDYFNASKDLALNLMLRGYLPQAWEVVERGLERARVAAGQSGAVGQMQLLPLAGSLLAMLGRPHDALGHLETAMAVVERAPDSIYRHSFTLQHQLMFHLEQGELGAPMDEIFERHARLGINPRTMPFHLRPWLVFASYARLAQAGGGLPAAREESRREERRRFRKTLSVLRGNPEIPSVAVHIRVLEAHLYRLNGNLDLAAARISEADRLAAESDSPWGQLEIAWLKALIRSAHGHSEAARRHAQFALTLAQEMGWRGRARRIRHAFALEDPVTTSRRPSATLSASVDATRFGRQLDALLGLSLAASSVFDPQELSRRALDEIVRLLGAERAFLFLVDEDGKLTPAAGRGASGDDLEALTGYSHTVVEEVRERDRPVLISGSEQGATLGSQSVALNDLRSILAVPLHLRDRLVGVIYVDNRLARGLFGDEDVTILQALGGQIAVALETARAARVEIQLEAERKQREVAETLGALSRGLSATLDLAAVFDRLLEGMERLVPFDCAAGLLVTDDGLRVVVSRGDSSAAMGAGDSVPAAEFPLLLNLLQARDAVRSAEPVLAGLRDAASWLGVPLIMKDRAVGLVSLGRRAPDGFSESEAELSLALAGQAGIAVENARLFTEVQHLAITDALTQLNNRGHFMVAAAQELRRAREEGLPLSLLMFDVDHFKKFNDTYGHAVGDRVLVLVSSCIRGSLRGTDMAARYGGEEFVVLLPGVALDEAASHAAERLRARVEGAALAIDDGSVRVTISIGVAQLTAEDAGLAGLLKRADDALYRAKAEGRNRVVAAR